LAHEYETYVVKDAPAGSPVPKVPFQQSQPKPQPRKRAPKEEESFLQMLASFASVFVVGLFFVTFIMQAFEIPSSSMVKTLLIGDHVFVDRVTLAPSAKWFPLVRYRQVRRGDIVVFLKPGEPDLFLVKRFIGVPGDHIHLKDGVVYLNGRAQEEPYKMSAEDTAPEEQFDTYRDQFPALLNDPGQRQTAEWQVALPSNVQEGDLVVPPGNYFAMGDNRPVSLDSRYWGFVPQANVVGRPLFVYWSFDTPEDQVNKHSIGERIGFLVHIVVHIFDQTRWSRTLHLVR
jgi:signal peptidase I